MLRAALALVLVAAAGIGCSSLAKQTPTPAKDISPTTLMNQPSPPGERYFMLIFGSESTPKRAKYTHTWATVVRVVETANGPPIVEPHTISWMPFSLVIRPLSNSIEPGTNLDLKPTIEEMLRHDEEIAVWGPFEVGYGLFQRFLIQKQFMESGRVGYQCVDSFGEAARTGCGCDCIHAITDMDPLFSRNRYPLSYFGQAGSRHIVQQIAERPTIIRPSQCNDWLFPLLGIDEYPIERQSWNKPVLENTPENVRAYLNSPSVQRQLAR